MLSSFLVSSQESWLKKLEVEGTLICATTRGHKSERLLFACKLVTLKFNRSENTIFSKIFSHSLIDRENIVKIESFRSHFTRFLVPLKTLYVSTFSSLYHMHPGSQSRCLSEGERLQPRDLSGFHSPQGAQGGVTKFRIKNMKNPSIKKKDATLLPSSLWYSLSHAHRSIG